MQKLESRPQFKNLEEIGIKQTDKVFWNLSPAELVEEAVRNGEGFLTDKGALMCDTGKFTGRSPKDRFIVKDSMTSDSVWWGSINQAFEPINFDKLLAKMVKHLEGKTLYVRDAYACAKYDYRLNLRVINTLAWHNLFCDNMFLRPLEDEKTNFEPDFTIINIPEFSAEPALDGTRNSNFAIINFTKKMILIGGTGYAGEMKKGIFSVLNFILPHQENVLPMHCSANIGEDGETAVFFGLSGTGKTTLSADPKRILIGDDEHGWDENSIFNFEGGCYAKVVNLTREKEPQIYNAIKFGAIVENTRFLEGTREVDYNNISVTQNTRTAYPIDFIGNMITPSLGNLPKNIFFLTCDSLGILPPISRLDRGQAMYHFISGYTAKVAGTETGVTEPKVIFSACFGAPFLPLHPTKYAEMLGRKMDENHTNVWLINTGWSGGSLGEGSRIQLSYTRAMVTAVLEGTLNEDSEFEKDPVFGVSVPKRCPNVPMEILEPRKTWNDEKAYEKKANTLALAFQENFSKYKKYATREMLLGAPRPL